MFIIIIIIIIIIFSSCYYLRDVQRTWNWAEDSCTPVAPPSPEPVGYSNPRERSREQMYKSNLTFNTPGAFDCTSCPGRGEFERCLGRVGKLNRIYLLFWRNTPMSFFGFGRVWRIYKIELPANIIDLFNASWSSSYNLRNSDILFPGLALYVQTRLLDTSKLSNKDRALASLSASKTNIRKKDLSSLIDSNKCTNCHLYNTWGPLYWIKAFAYL